MHPSRQARGGVGRDDSVVDSGVQHGAEGSEDETHRVERQARGVLLSQQVLDGRPMESTKPSGSEGGEDMEFDLLAIARQCSRLERGTEPEPTFGVDGHRGVPVNRGG